MGLGGWVRGAILTGSLLLSALLTAISVGTGGHPYLACVSLFPLLLAIKVLSPAKAYACGALWGASLFVLAAAGDSFAVPVSVGGFLLLTTIPAAYAAVGSLLTRRFGFSPLMLALGWVAVEFAMEPLGLRYGLLASTQGGGGTLLTVVGGVLGYVFVAFLIAYANALLLSLAGGARLSLPSFAPAQSFLTPVGRVLPMMSALPHLLVPAAVHARAPPRR